MKKLLAVLLPVSWFVLSLSSFAAGTEWKGVSVNYANANSVSEVDGGLVLTYTSTSAAGSLSVSSPVVADILVVGGGGGGGGARRTSNKNYYGAGGSGGSVRLFANTMLIEGMSYAVTVGKGGTAGSGSGPTNGGNGGSSSFGDLEAQSGGNGGSANVTASTPGGGASGSGTTGVAYSISGESVEYGKGGSSGGGSGTANRGNGGGGAAQTSSGSGTTTKNGAAGGNGVVVVRLKEVYSKIAATLSDLTLGEGEEGLAFTDASTGAAVDITYGNVLSMQFAPEGVARAERTRDGKLKIVWAGFGTTTATIVLVDKVAKAIITYTLHITTSSSVALQDLTIQRGETVTDFKVKSSGEAIRLEYDAVKDLKASLAGAAEVIRTENGEFGIVGKLAGVTDLMIVSAGQSYTFKVTVEKLLSGLYRAGAYEVAVTNASDVSYVDGDLVIAYRNTESGTAKSFTLPKPTAGRLLAIGGGGAGGTYKTPYAKSGALPGGGGAGRMIEKSDYALAAQKYAVEVGKGGAAATVNTSDAKGGDGGDTTVAGLTAKGGGGGGVKSAGNKGGSGGGGSASSSGSGSGGLAITVDDMGYGNAGGKSPSGNWHGAGGGGAGGAGGGSNTASATTVSSAWGVGGAGRKNDITGEEIEYARGGDGGWFPARGLAHEGKPGLDGRGDGGGGGCCSSENSGSNYSPKYVTTVGGRGGNGIVIVRIPAYKMLTEDALKTAFDGQPATVVGTTVTLNGDVTGPIRIPDNLGAVTIDLNGHSIAGADGADGDDITAGGDGEPALEIVPYEYESAADAPTVVTVTGTGSLKGGNGGTGHPAGRGAEALAGEASRFNVGSVPCTKGTDGVFIEQHPHEWAYRLEDGKIVATCIAPGDCSYKTREPFIAVKAEDANYTSMRYDGLNAVNGITPATGVVVAPEVYVGRDGTVYPASVTPPTEQGHYSAIMNFDGLSITSDFSIVELPSVRTNAYNSSKTAERLGRNVRITLSASFDGAMAINNSDVLFIGSCCQAHSMSAGTIEKTVNALAQYANVRWYAHNGIAEHASDSDDYGYVLMGKTINRSITLQDGNHCVYTKMMEDLWNELVLNVNQRSYGLIVLEFDGNLLGRIQGDAYQFVFDLPDGWDEDRVAILQAKMKQFYDANKVVWVVPSGNGSDGTATGGCPWTSQPECLWQRALFNTTEDSGFTCPLQHDYDNADKLTAYLKRVVVGHFFSNVIMSDKLAQGLTAYAIVPQMRNSSGIWCDFEGGPSHYTIPEPRSGTTVKADVEKDGRQVSVSFDMREEQAWACENNVMIGDEFRVVIDAEVDSSFFSGVAEGAEKSTNEGSATFTFKEPNFEGEGDYVIVLSNDTPTVKNVKWTPMYSAEDVVKTYDGLGTNIVVKPVDPAPDKAVIRYSLDEHGAYTDTLALTDACDKTKVWFTIVDSEGTFSPVTNFANVTILPRMATVTAENKTKTYGEDDPVFTAIATGTIGTDVVAYSISRTTGENVGDYTIVPSGEMSQGNYNVVFYPGTLTINPSPVLPKKPTGDSPAANPDDEPQSADGVTLWAQNVVKVYDGLGTNVVPLVYNAIDGNAFAYEYSIDGVSWTDDLAFTNVVDALKVYFRATPQGDVPNYLPTNGYAFVTITNRPVTVAADGTNMVYGATVPDLANHSWTSVVNLAVGDDIKSVAFAWTNETVISSLPVGAYEGFVSTNAIPQPVVVTNAAGADVTFNYSVSFVPGALTVGKAALSVTADGVIECYDGTAHRLADYAVTDPRTGDLVTPLAVSNSADGVTWYLKDDFPLYVNATNAAPVYIAVVADNYETFVSSGPLATVTVTQRVVTVTLVPTNKTYGAATPAWTVASTSGLVDGDSLAGTPGAIVGDEPANASGSPYEVTVDLGALSAGDNYTVVVAPAQLTIDPAPIAPAATGVEVEYDGEPHSAEFVFLPSAALAPDDVMTTNYWTAPLGTSADSSEWFSCGTENWVQTDVTNMSVKAEIVCTSGNFISTNVVADLVITPRVIADGTEGRSAVRANDTNMVFGATPPVPTWRGGDGLVPGHFLDVRLSYTNDPNYAAGTYLDAITTNALIAITNSAGADVTFNYSVSFVPGALTVGKAAMGIAVAPAAKTYDAGPTNVTWAVTNAMGAAISPDAVYLRERGTTAWIPAADFPAYVGVTNVTVEVKAEKSGFADAFAEATVTVSAKAVTVTADGKTKAYGEADPELTATVTGTLGTDAVVYTLSRVEGEGVGAYAITPSGEAEQGNYAVTFVSGTLTVGPASVGDPSHPGDPASGTGIDFTGEGGSTVPYKGTAWEPEVVCTNLFATLVKGVDYDIAYADNLDATNGAVIVITGKGNYTGVFTNYFTITKIPLTVTAEDKEIVFGSAAPGASFYTFAYSGFTNGETVAVLELEPTFGSAYTATTPVGTLPVTNATPGVARNYEFVYVPGTLAVAEAAMGIAVAPAAKTYDAGPTNVTWAVTNATGAVISPDAVYLREQGTAAWVPAADFPPYVGVTNVTVEVKAEKSGFADAFATAMVTVSAKSVTLASGSKTDFVYDGSPHAYTNLTATGFVEGEGLATTSDWATVVNVAEGEVGNTFEYTLKPNTLAGNYVITVNTGKIAVVAAPVIPKEPTGDSPAANPDDEPTAADPVTLWAENVVKVYDGIPTNIVPQVYNASSGNAFVYEYSLDETTWVSELAFTNVVDSQKVYFRATPEGATPNYLPTNCYAYVTITPAEIGIAANPLVIGPGLSEAAAKAKMSAVTNGTLIAGNEIVYTLGWTNDFDYAAVTPGETYHGVVLPTGAELQGNYRVVYTAADLIRSDKVALTLYVDDKVIAYGDAIPSDCGWKVEGGQIKHDCDEDVDWTKVSGTNTVTFAAAYQVGDPIGTYAINTNSADVTSAYYEITIMPGTLTVDARSIGPVPVDPEHPEGPHVLAPGFEVSPIDPLVYDGQAKKPEVAVTNGTVELVLGTDYTVAYFNNTNATEEAYAVITGEGNYGGCFTNYFTILPREVTLKSGTKTMYLDPERPGETVVCSNGQVWVFAGSFVTNSATGVEDGFVATVATSLTSDVPAGPIDNAFTAVVSPGMATNYCFTLIQGELAILSTPTNAHGEIHEEVPSANGKGVVDVVMDNTEAGDYAADKPPELDEIGKLVEKGDSENVEIRLVVSTNFTDKSYSDTTNAIVTDARQKGRSDSDIANSHCDAIAITVTETREYFRDIVHDADPTNVVVRDIGDEIEPENMLTIAIPYEFDPKQKDFTVWRNYTNENGETAGVKPLPYYGTVPATQESYSTNGHEVILHATKFTSIFAFNTVVQCTPQLTGRIQWKYFKAENAFYAGLDIACTNGDQTAISNLCYVYEDRADYYLRNLTSTNRLSLSSSWTNGSGVVFGKIELDADLLKNEDLGRTIRYGVLPSTMDSPRYVVSNVSERIIALASRNIPDLATNRVSAVVEDTLGYVAWQESGYDEVYLCAVGNGGGADALNSLLTGFCSISPPLMSLKTANLAVGYGLPAVTSDSDPTLIIDKFEIIGEEIHGRVVTIGADGARGVPGPNARLTVLGASEADGLYGQVAQPALDAQGEFLIPLPADKTYFRVRLSIVDIIK